MRKLCFAGSLGLLLAKFLLIAIIIGALVLVLVPRIGISHRGQGLSVELANARSLQQATQMMALDSEQSGKGLIWTSRERDGKMVPATLAEYLSALAADGYVTESDLRKILGVKGTFWNPKPALTQENIAYRFFWVDKDSPADQPFIVTANWQDGKLIDREPFRLKRFVFFTKGGSGGVRTRPSDADDLFPAGSEKNPAYHREVLK